MTKQTSRNSSKHVPLSRIFGKSEEYKPFGRAPMPAELQVRYGCFGPIVVVPRHEGRGLVPIAIVVKEKLAIWCCAVYQRDGTKEAIPTPGTRKVNLEWIPQKAKRFFGEEKPFEILPDRPLRTREDAIAAAEHWVRHFVDGQPLKAWAKPTFH